MDPPQQWRQLRRGDPEADRDATLAKTVALAVSCVLVLLLAAVLFIGLLFSNPDFFLPASATVRVASLSLSLSSVRSPSSAVSGNWSTTLSVRNRSRWRRIGWDSAQVMLFYGDEFVAGAFLERFSVAPKGTRTLETGAAAFSRNVGERVARAMGRDGGDGGEMEWEVALLHHRDGWPYSSGWQSFDCWGLKLGFSSQNQSQAGVLLSGSPLECK